MNVYNCSHSSQVLRRMVGIAVAVLLNGGASALIKI